MFPRDFRRPKRAKFKIYLSFEGAGLPLWLSLWGGGGVHWVQAVHGAGASGVLRCVFRPFLPAFSPFAASALLRYLLNMSYFAF